jgi:predicted dehydrogenase
MFFHRRVSRRVGDAGMRALPVPARYRQAPAALTGHAVNVAELYAEFAKGEAAGYPVPDFAAALTRHRLLDAIERSAASGCRVTLS